MASCDDSRIVIPFMPSLFHLSSVRIAVPFFTQFRCEVLDKVFTEIRQGNLTTCEKIGEETLAKESLLFIPAHLRGTVVQTVHRLKEACDIWRSRHRHIFVRTENLRLTCRSDGTIHEARTAQNLVLDREICIEKRFRLACMYFLDGSVRELWAEMNASGQTENLETADDPMVQFWVRWLREGFQVPWTQAIQEYLDLPMDCNSVRKIKFSTFFPFLRPEDRQKYFDHLMISSLDDLKFCLSVVTKAERKQIMKRCDGLLLYLHLQWPLQTLFLEAAEKVWDYLSEESFKRLLLTILDYCERRKYFNYRELLEGLWLRSPSNLKEMARECVQLREMIDLYLNKTKNYDNDKVKK